MNTAVHMRGAHATWRESNPITAYLGRHKMSRNEFAALAGVSARTVQAWQWGSSSPAADRTQELSTLLGLKPEAFRRRWREWEGARPGQHQPTKP